jgi:uncharacterized membrane protein
MTEYLTLNDLKAYLIGILGGLTVLGMRLYWSNHSIKSLNRRIRESEAEKVKLDNLAKSDRALIIYGFQSVFVVFALVFVVFGFQTLLATKKLGESLNGWEILQLGIWIMSCLLCIVAARSFQKIADHPKSLEKIDARIAKLKDKLSGR